MKKRILTVDPSATLRNTLHVILTAAGYHVDGAGSIALAKEAVQLYNYDFVLVELNGYETHQGLDLLYHVRRNNNPTVMVMALTNDDSTASKIGFFGRGGDDYLTKPFHREELLARISAIMNRHKRVNDAYPDGITD